MFGFQRTGDQFWAAADQRARGFLIGATAGRTTLNGEGLQHQDGHSHLLAASNPAVAAYNPSFAYEIAVFVRDGLERMVGGGEDVMYYLTTYNEPATQPAMPDGLDESHVVRGLYRYNTGAAEGPKVQLLTSGSTMPGVLEAQRLLADDWGVSADVWSAPGWVELHRDGVDADAFNRTHPDADERVPWVTEALADGEGPYIAVTDYQRAVPELIAPWVPGRYATLGTDGFGRSDTRANLRRAFGIDAASIVHAALSELADVGEVKRDAPGEAITTYGLNPEAAESYSGS